MQCFMLKHELVHSQVATLGQVQYITKSTFHNVEVNKKLDTIFKAFLFHSFHSPCT